MPTPLIFAEPDLLEHRRQWLNHLENGRRLQPKTIEAYERDTRQFLSFLSGHLGAPAGVPELRTLKITDLRSYLACRRGSGSGARSLARGLAGIRSFFAYLRRQQIVDVTAANALTTPRQARSLPRPVAVDEAQCLLEEAAEPDLASEPWVGARDAAILSLLYGCGLRISEALGLSQKDLPALETGLMRVLGKGGRERLVPVLPAVIEAVSLYANICPFVAARADLPESPCSMGCAASGSTRVSCRNLSSICASASVCLPAPRRMRCVMPLQPIFWPAVAICVPFRSCWAMPACRPRKSIRRSIRGICCRSIPRRIPT